MTPYETLRKKVHWSIYPFLKSFTKNDKGKGYTLVYVLDGQTITKQCNTYEEAAETLDKAPFFVAYWGRR